MPNFNLVDLHDRDNELYRARGKAVVLFFTGVGCPWKEIFELKLFHIPYMLDRKQAVSLTFGVQRTAEVIGIETEDWGVFYRGAIDDRFSEGAEKPAPAATPYLENALRQFLAGESRLL